jgi:hypothetical protein
MASVLQAYVGGEDCWRGFRQSTGALELEVRRRIEFLWNLRLGEKKLKRRQDDRFEEMTSPDGGDDRSRVHIADERHAFDLLAYRDIAIRAFVPVGPRQRRTPRKGTPRIFSWHTQSVSLDMTSSPLANTMIQDREANDSRAVLRTRELGNVKGRGVSGRRLFGCKVVGRKSVSYAGAGAPCHCQPRAARD